MFPNNYMYLTDKEEEKLFSEASIYFDASALLALYYFSDKSAKDIFDNLISKSVERNYITEQNWFEFNKNKEKVRIKPVNLYKLLIDAPSTNTRKDIDGAHIQKIREELNDIKKNALQQIINHGEQFILKTKKSDKHPFINKDLRERFDKQLINLKKKFDEFMSEQIKDYESLDKEIKKEINSQIESINSKENQNNIPNMIDKSFKIVPVKYTFADLIEIIKEGEIRYKNKIPPGYADDRDKEGIQKYGDLISWKQLLAHSKFNNTASIYITNDKKDMFSEETDSPKIDLIKEHYDNNNCRFWIFNLADFIYKLEQKSPQKLQQETKLEVEEMKESINIKESNDILESTIIKGSNNILNDTSRNMLRVPIDKKLMSFQLAIDDYISSNHTFKLRNEPQLRLIKLSNLLEVDLYGTAYYKNKKQGTILYILYLKKPMSILEIFSDIIEYINSKNIFLQKIDFLIFSEDRESFKILKNADFSNFYNDIEDIEFSFTFALFNPQYPKLRI